MVGNGLGVAGVAGIDPHGDGPAIGVGQGTVDDDRAAGLAITVVAIAGQRTGLPLIVAAGDIVEHQGPVAQVPLGELLLDRWLTLQQPVHGVVELICRGLGDVQLLGQGGVLPVSGVGQLGAGEQQPFGDHSDDQIAALRRLSGDEVVEAELADHREDGVDMAVRARARDAKGVGHGNEGLALERATDEVDDVDRKVREVSEGFMLDLPVLSEGASEVVTGISYSLDGVGDFGDMDSSVFACHAGEYRNGIWSVSRKFRKDFGYNWEPKSQLSLCCKGG